MPRSSASHAAPMSGGYSTVTLTLVALVTMIAFEEMSISTIMPEVARDLDAQGWYALAFSLMMTTQLLGTVLAGPWIDQNGPLPAAFVGQALFGLGSLLAGLAPVLWLMLAGRLVAGLGAGLVIVALYVVIGGIYPQDHRPRVFAWLSAAWVLPSVVGPLLAAWLTRALTWRAVFLVVLPVVAVTAAALWSRRAMLPHRPPSDTLQEQQDRRRVARRGLVVATGAGVFQFASGLPASPPTLLLTLLGGLIVVRTAPRLVPPGTVRLVRGLPSVMAARFLLMVSFSGAIAFVPLLLVEIHRLSLTQAGAVLALVSIGWALGSYLQGRPGLRGRGTILVTVGGVCVALALFGIAAATAMHVGAWTFVPVLPLGGVGMGMATSAMSVLTLDLVPEREHAGASSSLQLSDVLGSIVGISGCGALYAALHSSWLERPAVFALIWTLTGAAGVLAATAGSRTRASTR